ncbi:hypothetical protein AGOR_G00056080 [Albula goreensis]|uniref:Uncharacterized protein n=1 Tax=Albula goreensis TaxID=1534307 RepID=A0A8T3DVB5_9TELE|nr:hypothetical protein AGOR_G00056080 [Albula goreensis]
MTKSKPIKVCISSLTTENFLSSELQVETSALEGLNMSSMADILRGMSICVMMLELMPHPMAFSHTHKNKTCNASQLTNLAKSYVNSSLDLYLKENGKNIRPWGEPFPDLEIPDTLNPDVQKCQRVKKGLLFMKAALKVILKQQETDLNPMAQKLLTKLNETIDLVKHVYLCVANTVCSGGHPPTPTTPNQPHSTYEKKKWDYSVLMSAEKFLAWLAKWLKARQI